MSERTKIIAETVPGSTHRWRIWDNGDVELLYLDSWSLRNPYDNTDLWKKNIRKLIPGKRYLFMNWYGDSSFERCFGEATSDHNGVVIQVHSLDPIKCTECNSENTKDLRCLDCGEWL